MIGASVRELDPLDDLGLERPVARPRGSPLDRVDPSIPSATRPKTVCLPSSQGAASVVTMKNWEPLVSGPAFAIASAPRTTLCSLISSSNV